MKHLFVPYELALKLKEKGFDEECFARYNGGEFQLTKHQNWNLYPNVYRIDVPNTKIGLIKSGTPVIISAPLYQQVIDWFREKYKIHVAASSFPIYNGKYGYQYQRAGTSYGWTPHFEGNSYYEALNKAIEEALKLIP